MTKTPNHLVACNFCEKDQNEVGMLVAGPNDVAICDECIEVCMEVLAEHKAARAKDPKSPGPREKSVGD